MLKSETKTAHEVKELIAIAEAFSALPQTEQSILILHCTLDLADGEIGNLVGMSRSAVQRHRTKALQELRETLSALMPKGG